MLRALGSCSAGLACIGVLFWLPHTTLPSSNHCNMDSDASCTGCAYGEVAVCLSFRDWVLWGGDLLDSQLGLHSFFFCFILPGGKLKCLDSVVYYLSQVENCLVFFFCEHELWKLMSCAKKHQQQQIWLSRGKTWLVWGCALSSLLICSLRCNITWLFWLAGAGLQLSGHGASCARSVGMGDDDFANDPKLVHSIENFQSKYMGKPPTLSPVLLCCSFPHISISASVHIWTPTHS